MEGVLVIDKPEGLTSHDVVAAARRLLGETRIGHTGTLDPLATGVLPLAVARATRLARFLSSSDKDYDATIRFGVTTDTYDITGAETSRSDRVPPRDAVLRAIQSLTGDYSQMPPPYSAKKVQGRRAYELAREQRPVALTAVPVRVARAELVDFSGAQARVVLTCSAGFYVRSFAHALGDLTGTGACLETLRRTRSGAFSLDAAIPLDALQDRGRVAAALVPLAALLRHLPDVRLSPEGRAHVGHGRELQEGDYVASEPLSAAMPADSAAPAWVRLLDGDGALVGLATPGSRPGSLHPSLVLI